MAAKTDKGLKSFKMEENMKEIGKMIKRMESAYFYILIMKDIKVNFAIIKNKEKGFFTI